MTRVPGEPLGGTRLSASEIDGLGAALGRLFAVPVEPGIEERAWGPSTMRAGVREWISGDHDVGLCREPELVRIAIEAAQAWLAREQPDLDGIVDPVVARGDGNLDNALWDGDTCRPVDFEEFGVSDIAYEMADVLEHASSRLDRRLDTDALIATVGLKADQLDRLASYRALMACFWLVMLLPGNGGFKRNPAGSAEDQATHLLSLLDG
jgi:Ser/Thr protein kinase RdoA (MazF antagonist)